MARDGELGADAKLAARAAPNPPIDLVTTVLANPPRGRTFGAQVDRIFYRHSADGQWYVHRFDGEVRIEALPDGSLHLYSPRGVRLWDDFD